VLFTSYLPMLGGFLRVLRLLPPLTLVAIHEIADILLKVAQKWSNQNGVITLSAKHYDQSFYQN
jgi:hypothetical protein